MAEALALAGVGVKLLTTAAVDRRARITLARPPVELTATGASLVVAVSITLMITTLNGVDTASISIGSLQ